MSKLDELLAEFEKQAAAHAGGDLIYVRDFQREYDLLRSALREREGMVMVPRDAWKLALNALTEAEAILGGEYGDTYGVLCQTICELESKLAAAEGK